MLKLIFKYKFSWVILAYYLFIVLWWFKIFFSGSRDLPENYWFNLSYGLIALTGSVHGLYLSYRIWGGHKSVIGRGIIFLSLGLLGEWFGNVAWGYGNIILKEALPYPGIADIGFFSIIPLYALASLNFAHAAGAKFSLQNINGKLLAIAIPLLMVSVAWYFFLKDIPFDLSNPIKLFLDYGYPGGEAITVSITLLTYQLTRKLLGGKMRAKVLFVILALIAQYVTDYSFLYSAGKSLYYNANFVDLMYATSLTLMTLCIISYRAIEA